MPSNARNPRNSSNPRNRSHPDLPDPLGDSQDVPMASAEDLLSEIAGDDVERLISGEFEPVTGHQAVHEVRNQLGNFLEELRHRERAAPPAVPHKIREEDVAPLDDLVAPTSEELIGLHSGEFDEPIEAVAPKIAAAAQLAESRALLAPVDPCADDPAYLKPLDWIAGPIASMSPRGRVMVSLASLASFVTGAAALAYVLMLRHAPM